MSKGLLPYIDFWTHKAPLLVMILSGWISLFSHSMVSAVIFLILVTIIASYLVYAFSNALGLGFPVAIVALLGYVFFTATHLLDPTRNGIIVILASVFEMLAVINLITGLKQGTRQRLLLSGFFVFLAFATRQTAAITYLGLMAIIFVTNRKKNLRQALEQAMIVSLGSIIAAAGFIAYFVLKKIPFDMIWDQIYTFNINYAAGYQAKFTDWVFGWMDLLQRSKLHIIGIGVLAYFIGIGIRLVKRMEIRTADWMLIILTVLHSLAIYLQHKVQIIYFLQVLPEASVMTGIALADAFGGERVQNIKDFFKGWSSVAFVVASLLFLLLLPLKDEALYSYGTIQAAKENGYLQNIEYRPEYLVARKVQELAPNSADRIWVFGFGDEVYMYADRLPALTFTDAARLQYVLSPEDYGIWLDQFMSARPTVVVSYVTQAWMEANKNKPVIDDGGRSTENLLKIAEFITENMTRVSYELDTPEIYIWR